MAEYRPDKPRTDNPIGCVASWIGGLFRPRGPSYTTPVPASPGTSVARVRAIDVERAPAYRLDGAPCDGSILSLTLVVDDEETAAVVLDALWA